MASNKIVSGRIGNWNENDWYSFVVTGTQEINLDLSVSYGAATVQFVDPLNLNDASPEAYAGNATVFADGEINDLLVPGTYYLDVEAAFPSDTQYSLNISAGKPTVGSFASDTAGHALASATNIGTLTGKSLTLLGGFSGLGDADYYAFTISTTSLINLTLSGNVNVVVDILNPAGTQVGNAVSSYDGNGSLIEPLNTLLVGTYYIELTGASGVGYNLAASATAITPGAGTTIGTARQLGTLTTTVQSFTDALNAATPQEFYAFSLSGTSRIGLTVSGTEGINNGGVEVEVLNAAGQILGTSNQVNEIAGYEDPASIKTDLTRGQYYIEVLSVSDTSTPYTLAVNATPLAVAPATVATATNIGTLGTQPISESAFLGAGVVGTVAPTAVYEFELSSAATVTADLSPYFGNEAEMDEVILLTSAATTIGSATAIGGVTGNNGGLLTETLAAGTYYAEVTTTQIESPFTLTLSTQTPVVGSASINNAGTSVATARNLGTLTATGSSYADYVGPGDTDDYYQITLANPSLLDLSATGLADGNYVKIKLLDATEQQIDATGAGDISNTLPPALIDEFAAGTYDVDVEITGSGKGTGYSLSASATPITDFAGSSMATAQNIGTLGTTQNFSDFVGTIYPNDYYEFTLATPSVLSADAATSSEIAVDLLDATGSLVQSGAAGYNTDFISSERLPAGTYFVDVNDVYNNASDYTLSLGATPIPADAAGISQSTAENLGTFGAASVACFASGTRIRLHDREVAVEALALNDHVVSALDGRSAPITWIGHRHIDCRKAATPSDLWPIRISAGAFAPNTPQRDLYLSPDHAIYFDGALIPIRTLVNGTTIVSEPRDQVTYWHVELAKHDVLFAERLPCETYLDTGNRAAFANGGAVVMLRPEFSFGAGNEAIWEAASCAVLQVDGPIVTRLAAKLRARAQTLALGHEPRRSIKPHPSKRRSFTHDLRALLRPDWYLATHPDVAAAGMDVYEHYTRSGRQEGRLPCAETDLIRGLGLVDPTTVAVAMADVVRDGGDSVAFFCATGWREMRVPNPYFDTAWYVATHDVPPGMNPLLHYILFGEALGLQPGPHFDPAWYRQQYGLEAHHSPLSHYLQFRRTQNFSPLPGFDLSFWRSVRSGRDPYAGFQAAMLLAS